MPISLLRAMATLGCCLVLGACGQRGPLYLPQPAPADQNATPAGKSGEANPKPPASSAVTPP